MMYSTPLKSTSLHTIQRPTPSSTRSYSAPPSTASSPSCSPSPPCKRLTRRRRMDHNNNLSLECLRLLTKSHQLFLGIASLLVTWLLTASPYERMALEKFSRTYDLPEDVKLREVRTQYLRFGAPEEALLHTKPPKPNHVHLKPKAFLPVEPLQVHFLADATTPETTSKFILDGLERSQYMEITSISIAQLHATERQLATLQVFPRNPEVPLVYVVDWGSMNRDCGLLQSMLAETSIQYTSFLVLMDFSASTRHTECAFLEDYQKVKYTKRSVVEKRYFDTTFQWVYPGRLVENDVIYYAPLVVRESFVDLLRNVTTTSSTEKTRNVLFNWKPGDNAHYGFLRRLVAEKVQSYGGNVTSFAGSDWHYVQAMVQSKIVVLTQRDEWEGHYRLMEAMASGAMVLTDPMLALPYGLKNGTNLVVYRDMKELKHFIRYYLGRGSQKRAKIAQAGQDAVMGRHRSWHRMEEIIFGQAYTQVGQPDKEAPPKRERPELKLVEH